jgi:hypothetical protein
MYAVMRSSEAILEDAGRSHSHTFFTPHPDPPEASMRRRQLLAAFDSELVAVYDRDAQQGGFRPAFFPSK